MLGSNQEQLNLLQALNTSANSLREGTLLSERGQGECVHAIEEMAAEKVPLLANTQGSQKVIRLGPESDAHRLRSNMKTTHQLDMIIDVWYFCGSMIGVQSGDGMDYIIENQQVTKNSDRGCVWKFFEVGKRVFVCLLVNLDIRYFSIVMWSRGIIVFSDFMENFVVCWSSELEQWMQVLQFRTAVVLQTGSLVYGIIGAKGANNFPLDVKLQLVGPNLEQT
jgi:hypothetical protein